ncbi:hypothetical protein NPIL_128191 [Nephila pilipes]|uniref:Uncharacterized protein n=1 Tax=Nephila pilipes TaxID=299642 RepID=A0A8X6P8Y4_NEPPI|nr:hypothetical protein NPIL_128191 [Nephila pilipes]
MGLLLFPVAERHTFLDIPGASSIFVVNLDRTPINLLVRASRSVCASCRCPPQPVRAEGIAPAEGSAACRQPPHRARRRTSAPAAGSGREAFSTRSSPVRRRRNAPAPPPPSRCPAAERTSNPRRRRVNVPSPAPSRQPPHVHAVPPSRSPVARWSRRRRVREHNGSVTISAQAQIGRERIEDSIIKVGSRPYASAAQGGKHGAVAAATQSSTTENTGYDTNCSGKIMAC